MRMNTWCKMLGEGDEAVMVSLEINENDAPAIFIRVKVDANFFGVGCLVLEFKTRKKAKSAFAEIDLPAAQKMRTQIQSRWNLFS